MTYEFKHIDMLKNITYKDIHETKLSQGGIEHHPCGYISPEGKIFTCKPYTHVYMLKNLCRYGDWKDEFEKDITEQISNVEYQKIINNKKFNFLPCCEKYEDEETLFSSKNLQCLTEDQKKEIVKNYKRGDWIYKIPELKVKLLTQNIGVYEDHEENNEKKITQYIYCKDEEKDFGIEKITDDEYINEKIIPISENYFNIFDRDEYEDLSNTENSKNYQWKIEIPFKNELQMKSFLKLLILSRKNINENLRKINLDKKFSIILP